MIQTDDDQGRTDRRDTRIDWFDCPNCGHSHLEEEWEQEWLLSLLPLVLFRELATVECPDCLFTETYVWRLSGPYLEGLSRLVTSDDSSQQRPNGFRSK